MNTNTTNKVVLTGTVMGQPTYSHTVFGENFHIVQLSVPRLSGNNDTLPISLSEHLLSDLVSDGNTITVVGQLRSYNKLVETHSKLLLTVFVQDVLPCDNSINPNTMELDGYICKAPVYRTTPFNREICDILLAVNRPYNKSDYIPCIIWGRTARFASTLSVGQHIHIVGRVQSRQYQKKQEDGTVDTRTTYEVSVTKLSLVEDIPQPTESTILSAVQ